jgi:hypothetical protein
MDEDEWRQGVDREGWGDGLHTLFTLKRKGVAGIGVSSLLHIILRTTETERDVRHGRRFGEKEKTR